VCDKLNVKVYLLLTQYWWEQHYRR